MLVVPYFYQKPTYIYNVYGATSPATPFISFYILYGGPFTLGVVIGYSILIFLFPSTTWTIHQRPPRLRRLYTTDNFSCSYSSRRGREKERERSWPSIRNFLRVFRCVPRSVWQVQSCVIYIYKKEREREGIHISLVFLYQSVSTFPCLVWNMFVVSLI